MELQHHRPIPQEAEDECLLPPGRPKTSLPTAGGERIETLDVIRGFAVLGILLMNIQSFAMIGSAYLNPTIVEGHEGAGYIVWYLCHLLADSKFISIFSMLFGAGIVLMANRQTDRGLRAWPLHYRRMFGLLVIGLVHAYALWYGDILVPYAICGALLFPLWRLSAGWLLVVSMVLFFFGAVVVVFFGWSMSLLSEAELAEVMSSWQPSAELIREEINAYRGPWSKQFAHRAESALMMQSFVFPTMIGWRIGGLMLMGMALFKLGFLSGERSKRALAATVLIGLGVGLPMIAMGARANEQAGWTLQRSMFTGSLPNYFGSLFVALAYIAMIGLFMKGSFAKRISRWLAPVGRMALTNYLMQSLICTTIFYGHGLGWFAQVDRLGQIAVVAGVWAFQIVMSAIWMKRFRFGPVEYAWRCASYGRLSQFRRDRTCHDRTG